jgi:hypothetical protein
MRFERGISPKASMGIGVKEIANRIFREMNSKAPFWTRIEPWDWAIETWEYDSGITSSHRTASLVFTKEALKGASMDSIMYEASKVTRYPEYRIVSHENGKNMLITIEYWLNIPDF